MGHQGENNSHLRSKDPNLSVLAIWTLNEKKQSRVAIGTFDRIDSLSTAVKELSLQKSADLQIVLIADQDCLNNAFRAALGAQDMVQGEKWPALVFWDADIPTDQQVAVAGVGGSGSTERTQIIDFEQWIAPAMAARLKRQLENGACLLFAVVETPDQEQKVCGVLFEHSIGQVQVHDFSHQEFRS